MNSLRVDGILCLSVNLLRLTSRDLHLLLHLFESGGGKAVFLRVRHSDTDMSSPFWTSPMKYLKWAAHERPNVFYSLLIGAMGPITLIVVPPVRKAMGIQRVEAAPLSYPCKKDKTMQWRILIGLWLMFDSAESCKGECEGV